MRTNTGIQAGRLINWFTSMIKPEQELEFSIVDEYEITREMADVLDVSMFQLVSIYDTEEKIICIATEIMVDNSIKSTYLSRKYRINHSYMLNRLEELNSRITTDPVLQMRMLALAVRLNINF